MQKDTEVEDMPLSLLHIIHCAHSLSPKLQIADSCYQCRVIASIATKNTHKPWINSGLWIYLIIGLRKNKKQQHSTAGVCLFSAFSSCERMEAAPVGGFGLDRTKRRGTFLPAPKKPLGATEHTEQRRDCLVSMSVSVMSKSVVP